MRTPVKAGTKAFLLSLCNPYLCLRDQASYLFIHTSPSPSWYSLISSLYVFRLITLNSYLKSISLLWTPHSYVWKPICHLLLNEWPIDILKGTCPKLNISLFLAVSCISVDGNYIPSVTGAQNFWVFPDSTFIHHIHFSQHILSAVPSV